MINAMRQALEALERAQPVNYCMNTDGEKFAMYNDDPFRGEREQQAITALRAAIEQAEKAEPFGVWHQGDTEDESDFYLGDAVDAKDCPNCIPLYTHPSQPQEGWQGCGECDCEFPCYEGEARCIRLAAAPKEKS